SNLLLFSRGFSPDDLPQRRAFQQDDPRGSPLQRSDSTRPSGRSIYSMLRTVEDCVAKLKNLNVKGRLWPQDMIMEVQGGYLLLSDIETKTELDSIPLSCIMQTKAVLNSCDYNSLLTVTVGVDFSSLYLIFVCLCYQAELIKSDLDKAVQRGGGDLDQRSEHPGMRYSVKNKIK
uniref:PTB domain-containing protein n=1 Tax=Amphilophus citrinellus TaxID=61819 RepID=A0A3Q0R8F8_AMPCI